MLRLTEKDISYLRRLLGYSLQFYSSTRLSAHYNYAVSYEGILALSFKRANEHKKVTLNVGVDFFETNWGKMYYDYSIEYDHSIAYNAEVHLDTSPIIAI